MHTLRKIAFYLLVAIGFSAIFVAIGSIDGLVETDILAGIAIFISLVLGGGFLIWLATLIYVSN